MGDLASAGHMTSFYVSSGDWALMSLDPGLAPAAWLLILESKRCLRSHRGEWGRARVANPLSQVLNPLGLPARWLRSRRYNSRMKAACWKVSQHLSFPLPFIPSSCPALEPASSGKRAHARTQPHFSHVSLSEVGLCLSPVPISLCWLFFFCGGTS